MNILERLRAARSAAVTCSASRHAAEIGETMARHGTCQMIADPVDAQEAGESIAATVAALWEVRAEVERLNEQLRLANIDAALSEAEVADLRADAARLDWLADPGNQIGNVQIPTDCVLAHPESMRAAIDMAMRMEGFEP